ncbi:YjhG/YagF family D-xylonate dehydratase [Succinatimonas hippei]|uniref:Putative dehydratase, YjhG/YagF family n=1 Tax=Succinatimonas hippei (strain DSM 22608 / JCM 16073 / KCTC 15190 / YIT 12066) TaxID=762983 RepID=E8LKD2_SUCHY|nr:YjhG/YagF family D-xylonate dehydratase [Succinatimonas hippei]EFY07015.1 putative dehydratase, YjhG/YagF family [Succinatimonas hippei YIT 12066]
MLNALFSNDKDTVLKPRTKAAGPEGALPLNHDLLRYSPSGDLFGMTMDAGIGWDPSCLRDAEVLILSNLGGMRGFDGKPVALTYHTGNFELGMLVEAASREFAKEHITPFAAYVTDPCDGRSQGTHAMFDSLPYRNDSAMVLRRLIRSLPTAKALMGVATCDKGLPGMMMALVSCHDKPVILVPGGTTLPPVEGEDTGKVQTIGARYANNEISLEYAAAVGCRSCASAGGGCHFLGTAGTSQVIAEALGLALTHSALAPSGEEIWLKIARDSAIALKDLLLKGIKVKDIVTDKAIENAMIMHAAFGGSTNLLLHLPAIAYSAGCKIPTMDDWNRINLEVPRIVSVNPNGPIPHPTVRAFLSGGVPEAMLKLRRLNILHEDVMTVTGMTLGENLDCFEDSERRYALKRHLKEEDGVDADDVIMDIDKANSRGLTSTITFPKGNIAPEGAVIKSTAIDKSVIGQDGVYRAKGAIKVFVSEEDAIKAIKDGAIVKGDIMCVIGGGPLGTGMEETYQLTSALKYLPFGKYVTLLTDARFSGVSTGACIGHIGPEALAGGPIGKLRDGDIVEVVIDTVNLSGTINFLGTKDKPLTVKEGEAELAKRSTHPMVKPHPDLPDDTALWAALQAVSGGTARGCVYDVKRILQVLELGQKALKEKEKLNA